MCLLPAEERGGESRFLSTHGHPSGSLPLVLQEDGFRRGVGRANGALGALLALVTHPGVTGMEARSISHYWQ